MGDQCWCLSTSLTAKGINDPELRAWFDDIRDQHNAEEKTEEAEPEENSQRHLIAPAEPAPCVRVVTNLGSRSAF